MLARTAAIAGAATVEKRIKLSGGLSTSLFPADKNIVTGVFWLSAQSFVMAPGVAWSLPSPATASPAGNWVE